MSWVEEAQRTWDEHQRAEQEEAERLAQRTVDYVERLRDRLHARPTAGSDRLGEQERAIVEGPTVRLALSIGRSDRGKGSGWPPGVLSVELRAEVSDELPDVHAWLLTGTDGAHSNWVDRGPVETLADLGRALDPRANPPAAPEPDPASLPVGELLLRVMQGLVRDVVADEMEGRYGGGKT